MEDYDKKVNILKELDELIGEKRKLIGKNSLEGFVDIYLHHLSSNKRPQFHKEIMANIEKIGLDKEKSDTRQLYIAPRGFAKSTLCSRFFPLWLALYGYKNDVFLISATISIAKENLRIIRMELENNEKLVQDFGIMKSDKWTEEQLVLSNGSIIRAKGQGFQIRGFRPDVIICDDLEDESVIYSKEQRDKLEVWFFRTLIPTLKPDQHLIYIGTKLHQFALIAKLEEHEEFKSHLYKALVDDKSIWEDAWPTEELLKRKKQSLYAFEAEYQNNPLSLEEQPIKVHHLDGVKVSGQIVESCMAIDPAVSEKETSDYRAIQIMGKTEEGEFRELLTVRGRWGIDEMVDKIIDTYVEYKNKWNILRVLVEEVAFQKVMRGLLIKKAREKDIYMPITSTELGVGANKRPKDKLTRLMQVVHLFEGRLVEIVNHDLYQELLAFPFGDYDDMVDVTVYNLYWLINSRPGRYMLKKEERGLPFKTIKSFYVDEVRPGVFMAKIGDPPTLKIKSSFINYDKSPKD